MVMLPIEVCYILPTNQVVLPLEIPQGTTVSEAIIASGILKIFPELKLLQLQVGIYSRKVALDHIVDSEDRIEIYRQLTIDPKRARQLRVAKKKRIINGEKTGL